jgi:N-acetyl-alpha-D-muramate 1-phosphate uridylyltransferase
MKVMILAAGRGQRMAPLTDHCPKPLLPLAGKPLIVHHLEKLAAAGFREVVINHAYLGYMLEQALGSGERWGLSIRWSAETEALETGGGIRQALPLLGDDPFLLVNGDVWTDWSCQISPTVLSAGVMAHLWLVDNPEHNPAGDFILHHDRVLADGEGPRLTFSGLSVINPALLARYAPGRFALAPVLRAAMVDGLVGGERLEARWVDVGTPRRLEQLEQELLKEHST